MVPKKADKQVAIRTAVASMPAAESMLGLIARIYAIVIKVVIPARTSVRTSVPYSLSLNNFSINEKSFLP